MGPAIVVENGSIHADGMKAVMGILSLSWWLRGRSERKLCNSCMKAALGPICMGENKTLNRLKERFIWPGHSDDVRN